MPTLQYKGPTEWATKADQNALIEDLLTNWSGKDQDYINSKAKALCDKIANGEFKYDDKIIVLKYFIPRLGAALARHDIELVLNGKKKETKVSGLSEFY